MMNFIIHKIFEQKNIFAVLSGKEEIYFFLPKRLHPFFDYIKEGFFVDFEIGEEIKRFQKTNAIEVSKFNKIIDRKNNKVYFDINLKRKEMFEIINKFNNLLFLDFEMTISDSNYHIPKIIAAGYVLTDKNLNIIKKEHCFIKPKSGKVLNDKTLNFLKLDRNIFFEKGISFFALLSKLENIITNYKPQIITWGNYDFFVLNLNAKYFKSNIKFDRNNFTDLQKLYRNYKQDNIDEGLFKIYNNYNKNPEIKEQIHNPLDDAFMTKDIYLHFLNELKEKFGG